jgi:hypothetical protein
MYQVSWMTKDEEDRFQFCDDIDDVKLTLQTLVEDSDVVLWTVGLVFEGSDPQHYDYEGLAHKDKAEFVHSVLDLLPADFTHFDLGATIMSMLSMYGYNYNAMSEFLSDMADTCKTLKDKEGVVLQ